MGLPPLIGRYDGIIKSFTQLLYRRHPIYIPAPNGMAEEKLCDGSIRFSYLGRREFIPKESPRVMTLKNLSILEPPPSRMVRRRRRRRRRRTAIDGNKEVTTVPTIISSHFHCHLREANRRRRPFVSINIPPYRLSISAAAEESSGEPAKPASSLQVNW